MRKREINGYVSVRYRKEVERGTRVRSWEASEGDKRQGTTIIANDIVSVSFELEDA